jgi:hypothetical protein
VAVDITAITGAQNLSLGSYTQAMTITKISAAGGRFRATLSDTLSAEAPVAVLRSQFQLSEAGARTSTPPFSINVYEDLTP